MNKRDLILRWINALRSGTYTPGWSQLRSNPDPFNASRDTYCCLGVLCDLHDKNGWCHDSYAWRYYDGAPKLRNRPLSVHSAHTVPSSLYEQFGLKSEKATIHPDNLPERFKLLFATLKIHERDLMHLASLNDALSKRNVNPFPIIAELIETALDTPEIGIFNDDFHYEFNYLTDFKLAPPDK
jgi:hypothetical protein